MYDLSVIPLFLLMGQFATQGGLSRALFQAAAAFVGHIRGGLAMAAILSAAAFGAVCGSSVATSATITQVAYPEMKAHGYHGRLSTATLAAGGTLGILIPPSVPLVVYAILTEQNIAKLFAAAMVPGIIATIGYLIVIALYCRVRPDLATPSAADAVARSAGRALLGVWPIVRDLRRRLRRHLRRRVLADRGRRGRRGGHLRRRRSRSASWTWQAIERSFVGTAETSAMVFMIFLGADMMNSALALTQMPAQPGDWVGAPAGAAAADRRRGAAVLRRCSAA